MKQPQHDAWPDLQAMSTDELVVRLQKYPFKDPIGHDLALCAEFIEIVRRAKSAEQSSNLPTDERRPP